MSNPISSAADRADVLIESAKQTAESAIRSTQQAADEKLNHVADTLSEKVENVRNAAPAHQPNRQRRRRCYGGAAPTHCEVRRSRYAKPHCAQATTRSRTSATNRSSRCSSPLRIGAASMVLLKAREPRRTPRVRADAAAIVHPLVRLAASRPQMLAEHAAAYVELFADEAAYGRGTSEASGVAATGRCRSVGDRRGTRRRRSDALGIASDAEFAVGAGVDAVHSDSGRRNRAARRVHENRARPVRAAATPAERRCGNAATGR